MFSALAALREFLSEFDDHMPRTYRSPYDARRNSNVVSLMKRCGGSAQFPGSNSQTLRRRADSVGCATPRRPMRPALVDGAPDGRQILWRLIEFLPIAVIMQLIYLRLRRLAPLVVAHWGMDFVLTWMALK